MCIFLERSLLSLEKRESVQIISFQPIECFLWEVEIFAIKCS